MYLVFKPVVTTKNPAEHELGYAYPSSKLATQLGHGRSGCFTVKVGDTILPAKTYSDAKAAVERLGTVPGRWSWDHPQNRHLATLNAEHIRFAHQAVTI